MRLEVSTDPHMQVAWEPQHPHPGPPLKGEGAMEPYLPCKPRRPQETLPMRQGIGNGRGGVPPRPG